MELFGQTILPTQESIALNALQALLLNQQNAILQAHLATLARQANDAALTLAAAEQLDHYLRSALSPSQYSSFCKRFAQFFKQAYTTSLNKAEASKSFDTPTIKSDFAHNCLLNKFIRDCDFVTYLLKQPTDYFYNNGPIIDLLNDLNERVIAIKKMSLSLKESISLATSLSALLIAYSTYCESLQTEKDSAKLYGQAKVQHTALPSLNPLVELVEHLEQEPLVRLHNCCRSYFNLPSNPDLKKLVFKQRQKQVTQAFNTVLNTSSSRQTLLKWLNQSSSTEFQTRPSTSHSINDIKKCLYHESQSSDELINNIQPGVYWRQMLLSDKFIQQNATGDAWLALVDKHALLAYDLANFLVNKLQPTWYQRIGRFFTQSFNRLLGNPAPRRIGDQFNSDQILELAQNNPELLPLLFKNRALLQAWKEQGFGAQQWYKLLEHYSKPSEPNNLSKPSLIDLLCFQGSCTPYCFKPYIETDTPIGKAYHWLYSTDDGIKPSLDRDSAKIALAWFLQSKYAQAALLPNGKKLIETAHLDEVDVDDFIRITLQTQDKKIVAGRFNKLDQLLSTISSISESTDADFIKIFKQALHNPYFPRNWLSKSTELTNFFAKDDVLLDSMNETLGFDKLSLSRSENSLASSLQSEKLQQNEENSELLKQNKKNSELLEWLPETLKDKLNQRLLPLDKKKKDLPLNDYQPSVTPPAGNVTISAPQVDIPQTAFPNLVPLVYN